MGATEANSKSTNLCREGKDNDNASFTAEFVLAVATHTITRKGLTRLTTLKQGSKPV